DAALELATALVLGCTDEFRLSPYAAGPAVLPAVRAHYRLCQADTLCRRRELDAARAALAAAEEDWLNYCRSVTELGFDNRVLWMEQIGYESLSGRVIQSLSEMRA
ncbi:MAG: hypothetical protein ACK6EB_43825, partial [Planctomyces sp.]